MEPFTAKEGKDSSPKIHTPEYLGQAPNEFCAKKSCGLRREKKNPRSEDLGKKSEYQIRGSKSDETITSSLIIRNPLINENKRNKLIEEFMSNDHSQDRKPGFYAIIPASVRYDSNLEMGARLLYGEITALAATEGYCWATNAYFAKLYDVEPLTITRWVGSLKDAGHITVQISKEGIQVVRKIWISREIQETSTAYQKRHPPLSKKPIPPSKNDAESITPSSTKKEIHPLPPKGDRDGYGPFVKLSKEEHKKLSDTYGPKELAEMIDAVNDHCAASRPQGYNSYAAAIRNFFRNKASKLPHGVPAIKNESVPFSANQWHSDHYTIGVEYGLAVIRSRTTGHEIGSIPVKNIEAINLAIQKYDFARNDTIKSDESGSRIAQNDTSKGG